MAYTSTSKYLAILPYVLLEYRYTTLPELEEYPVNFGTTTAGFEKIQNGYYGTYQILNKVVDVDLTGNTRNRSVVQTGDSTFVDLSTNYLVDYLDYDNRLTDTSNIEILFPSNILVQYDTIRFHFLSGYNFPDTDGVMFQIKYKDNSGVKNTFAQILIKKSDTDYIVLNPAPIYNNGGIYDKYVEIKIPALSNMAAEFAAQDGSPSQAYTLAALTSTNGSGYSSGIPFNISSWEITSTSTVNGYYTYVCRMYNTAVFNPFDEYSYLAANLVENTESNYWEYYPTWQGEFIDQLIYTENSLGNFYYLVNEIIVREQVGLRFLETSRFQTIQENDFNKPKVFRPIVMNSKATSFMIDYNIRLVNKVTNTSILRSSSVTSYNVDLYGAGLNKIQLRNEPYPLKVYNKVVESSKITSAYSINVNPVNNIITKYVPAFFESENITIAQQDVTITNIGSTGQTSSMDSTLAYGQGRLKIVVDPFDNYYKFRIFNSSTGAENTVLDLGNNSTYYLVFNGGSGNQIKIKNITDSTFQNPSKGEIAFRVVEADSKTIQNYTSRDFHITSVSPNGIETSLYYGTWILPSERYTKYSYSTSSGTSGVEGTSAVGSSGISGTSGTSGTNNSVYNTTNENVKVSSIKNLFDPAKDSIIKNISPSNLSNTITSSTPALASNTTTVVNIDMVALANSISGDEALNKSYKDITDYYTIPGRPGYNTYKGITKNIFLDAVRKVHPDVNGVASPEYTNYANYLGVGTKTSIPPVNRVITNKNMGQ